MSLAHGRFSFETIFLHTKGNKMYISLESCECNYPTAIPYKNFPISTLIDNIDYLLTEQSRHELLPLRELSSKLRKADLNYKEILIDYIHKNGIQDPNNLMTTKIDINDDHGYFRFVLAYNKDNFYHYAYSDTHEEDWECKITYHDHFHDEVD